MIRRFTLGTMVVGILLAGCGPAQRPAYDQWAGEWQMAIDLVPDLDGDPPSQAGCEEILGELREIQPELLPSPDRALDATVREWVAMAEQTFFECPPREGEVVGWDAAYAEMAALEAEVETVLERES